MKRFLTVILALCLMMVPITVYGASCKVIPDKTVWRINSDKTNITGRISYAGGQLVVLYNNKGKPISYQKMPVTGRAANFSLSTSKLKMGTTVFYVKALKSKTVSKSGTRAIAVSYTAASTGANKILSACKTQAVWMKNSGYHWEKSPTIAKSKTNGTCVTYVACVLQRAGYLKPGYSVWHTGSGHGTGKVTGATSRMSVMYMNNKAFKNLKGKVQPGDVVLVDDNRSGKSGSGGHVMIFEKWSGDTPIVWDNSSAQDKKYNLKSHAYGKNRKVLAIVRMK